MYSRTKKLRTAVAGLFVASLVAIGAVQAGRDDGDDASRVATATTTATTTTSTPASTTTLPATVAPAPPTAPPTSAAPTTVTTVLAPPPPAEPPQPVRAEGVVVTPRGVVTPLLAKEGDRYRVETPCGRTAVVGGTVITKAAVVLDAGHGGAEPGAVGPNDLSEKGINLAVVRHAEAALQRAGISVVLTRTADYRVTLATRTKIARSLGPRAFVSVHHNAEPDGPRNGPGTETFYQVASSESKRLAGLVYEEVVKALSQYQVPWVADSDAGAKYRRNTSGGDYYGILRLAAGVPAILAELAFISNPPEAELVSRHDVQQVEGEAVARGIIRFLTTKEPGSGFTDPYPRTSPAGGGGGSSNCVDPPL